MDELSGYLIGFILVVAAFFAGGMISINSEELEFADKVYTACEIVKPGSKPEVKVMQLPDNTLTYYVDCK